MSRKAKIELILDAAKARREMESLQQTVRSFTIDGKANVAELSKALKISQQEAQDLADKFKVVKVSAKDAAKASIIAAAKQKRAYQELGDEVKNATEDGIVNFKKLARALNVTEQEAQDVAAAMAKAGKKGAEAGKKTQVAWKSTAFTLNNVMSVAGMVFRVFGQIAGKALDVAIDRGRKFTQLNLLRMHHNWGLVKQDLKDMQNETGGLVRGMDILRETSKALNAGMIREQGELTEIVKIAQIKAAQMGMTFQETFERIVLGISKVEPEILDELALGMKGAEEVTRYYAESIGKTVKELTALEEKMAFQRGVLLKFKRDTEGINFNNALSQIDLLANRTSNTLKKMGDEFGEFSEKAATQLNKLWSDEETRKRREKFFENNKEAFNRFQMEWLNEHRGLKLSLSDMDKYYDNEAEGRARAHFIKLFEIKDKAAKKEAELLIERSKLLIKEKQLLAVQYKENDFTTEQINHIAKTRLAERLKNFDHVIEGFKKTVRGFYKTLTGKDAPEFLKKEATSATKATKGLVRYYNRLNAINSLKKMEDAQRMQRNFATRGLNKEQIDFLNKQLEKKIEILKQTDKLYKKQQKGNKKARSDADRKAEQDKRDRNDLNKFMLEKARKQAIEMKDIDKLEELSRSANQLELKKVEILKIQERIRQDIARIQDQEVTDQEDKVNQEDKANAERLKKAEVFSGKMFAIRAKHKLNLIDNEKELKDLRMDTFNNFVGTEEQKLQLVLEFEKKRLKIIEEGAKEERKIDKKALARKQKLKDIYISGMESAAGAFGKFVVDAAKGDAEAAAIALGTSIQTKGEDLIAESIKNGAMALGYYAIGDVRAGQTAAAAGVQFTTGTSLTGVGAGLGGLFSSLGLEGGGDTAAPSTPRAADTRESGTSRGDQTVNVTVKDLSLMKSKYSLQKSRYKTGGF